MTSALLLALALSAARGPAPSPAGEATSLVLVVASNRGGQGGRPALQYADDDGAKYFEVFSTIAGEENTFLLSDLDRDTARLFTGLLDRVRSPSRAQIGHVAAKLARKAAEARRLGRATRFYFVFAGHGDVDQGRGFLDLPDGAFTADDLQALLREVGASEAHVILDSCNSFFVVNPRRPGGVRFATPRDAAEALGRRLPNVGVFLSTSAQAEVYEWSELQSGVFSHAVRSGLMGAADANGDGGVSYEELAGFVDTAVADIKNPLYRPTVYSRGPNGEDARAILVRDASRTVLAVDDAGPVRLAARDADGLRWVDAYKEAGGTLELWFPPAVARRLEIDRLRTGEADRGRIEASFALGAGEAGSVRLAALAPAASTLAMRGPGEIFQALFARPFGPAAFAAYLARRAAERELALPGDGGLASIEAVAAPEVAPAAVAAVPGVAPAGVAPPEAAPADHHHSRGWRSLYAVVRPGFTAPLSSAATGTRPSVAAAVGGTLASWLAAELEAGYRDHTYDWDAGYPSVGYHTNPIPGTEVRVQAVPIALNLHFQVPQATPRPYLLLGAGLALVQATLDPPDFNATLRDHPEVPFFHAGLGLSFDLGARVFAGVEGRYSLATDLRVFRGRIDGQGMSGAAFLGLRL